MIMNDSETTLQEAKEKILKFAEERGWQPGLKNLATSLVLEAAEVLEHFQWLDVDQAEKACGDKAWKKKIGRELADVLFYLVKMCDRLDLDISKSLNEKLKRLAKKYPKKVLTEGGMDEYYRLKKEWRRKGRDQ
jgi:dCTP diphosphatase